MSLDAAPPEAASADARSPQPAAPAAPGVFETPAGRLLALSAVLLVVLSIVQWLTPLPELLDIFHKVVSLALIASGAWIVATAAVRNRRRLLWRVRRKLILSYLFLGVIPVVLVITFALAGGVVLYDNVAAYLFRQGFDAAIADVHEIAETAAIEIGATPSAAGAALANRYASAHARYPGLSMAVVPGSAPGGGRSVLTAGPWAHAPAPRDLPAWVMSAHGFSGALAIAASGANGATGAERLLIRAVVPAADGRAWIVVDLPCDEAVARGIEARTGTRMGSLTVSAGGASTTSTASSSGSPQTTGAPFQRTVAFMQTTAWDTGQPAQVVVSLQAPLGQLYQRMALVESAQLGSAANRGLVLFLIVLASFFAIIQGSALVMGGALARSITYAVHELFIGTERVRQGDFTHRIRVDSQDQLGDLAESFNRMSGSIEHLLHVQREKQRLDDELRIAREIQHSLLPVQPPQIAGLSIADLCEPAREVGGDYYDFFLLGPRQLGVLVADVSGKGTSAALYMAELKGLMLATSQTERSPRRLLITVNRLLAEHLDNRSFITATYAVIDLEAMTLTSARAGHTPMLVVSGGVSEVVVPSGMVLGLRLPGSAERFDTLLEEHVRPVRDGDVIALYTDGITEAMNEEGDLFGEPAFGDVLAGVSHLDAAGIRERVVRDVRAFVGEAEPHDDMTMVVIKVTGPRRV